MGKQKKEKKQKMMKNREAPSRQLTTLKLSHALETIEQRLQCLEDNDCNAEGSRIAKRGVPAILESYKKLLHERRTCCETKQARILFSSMKKQLEDDEALPSASNTTSIRP
ncbi:hypothetical protein M514_02313 [Trichuris suis]|nr:hypothetical protein M513_02313 [Trichuris suis]KFD66813.1 hypothetical protein M514_02313 [Trichuris suis]